MDRIIRGPYDPSVPCHVQFPEPSLTVQSFKDECDINQIMTKYEKTGVIDHLNTHQGNYGDFLGFEDYQTHLNQIAEAGIAFASIPAKIRAKFDNDPAKFLEFAQNSENLEEMQNLGLAPKKAPEPPDADPAVKTTPPKADPSTPAADPPAPPEPLSRPLRPEPPA